MLPKKIFKSLDNVTKKLWFTLPLPILAYPIYLWSRSRWKKGSHFHPHRDLFVPNERKDVITSTICWTAVVSLLAGLSFVMGPVQLLKLYVIPYLLVGVTAMLLVCKYEEGYVPVVDDLIMIFDKAYSRKEILDMEKLMVNTLQFNLSVPTSYVFMRRFLKSGQSDKKLELLSFFKIELCLVECEMLRFPPSLLAAAAVLKAQCTLNGRR